MSGFTSHRSPLRRFASPTVWALGIALVAGGVVLGSSTTTLLLRGRVSGHPATGDGPDAEAITARLRDTLDLSTEQERAVRDTMRERIAALAGIRADAAARVAVEHEMLEAQMRRILGPDQFARWWRQFEAIRRRRSAGIADRPAMAPGDDAAPASGLEIGR